MSLPQDVLTEIFSYLSLQQRIAVERVCKRWQSLIYHSLGHITLLDSDALNWTSEDLIKVPFREDDGYASTKAYVKQSISNQRLGSVLRKVGKSLKSLTLRQLKLNSHHWIIIKTLCPTLEKLTLSGVALEADMLKSIDILELIVEDIFLVTQYGILTTTLDGVAKRKIIDWINSLPHLSKFTIGQCDMSFTEQLVVNNAIRIKIENAAQQFASGDVSCIFGNNLTSLNLGHFSHISTRHISTLTNLVSLSLSQGSFGNEGLRDHIACLTNLQELSLSACKGITDFKSIDNLLNLQVLDLSGTMISDQDLSHIVSRCRQIIKLNLSTTRISDAALTSVSTNLSYLKLLQLYCCRGISDRGPLAVIGSCKQLTTLNLEWCQAVSDKILEVIGKSPCGLRFLDISFTTCTMDAIETLGNQRQSWPAEGQHRLDIWHWPATENDHRPLNGNVKIRNFTEDAFPWI